MGANGSHNKTLGRIKAKKRTHREFHDRIDGHKILLQNKNQKHVSLPVNSNSESPIYLGAKKIGNDAVEVSTIGIYENHKLVGQIDLKFDKNGDVIPYQKGNGNSSHFHYFTTDPKTGMVSRKSHDKTNTYPIDSKWHKLCNDVADYNKAQKKK